MEDLQADDEEAEEEVFVVVLEEDVVTVEVDFCELTDRPMELV